MAKSSKKPFLIDQIVKAKVSYRPAVIAGNHYRVREIVPARSFSGWMVGVAGLGRSPSIVETLDAGYFSRSDIPSLGTSPVPSGRQRIH